VVDFDEKHRHSIKSTTTVTHAAIFISQNRNGHEVGGGGCVFHSASAEINHANWRALHFAGFQLQ
jgi:hypothetical protein